MKRKWLLIGAAALAALFAVGTGIFYYTLNYRVVGDYFDSDGVRLHYVDEGQPDGEPVVLVHGLAANIDINWRRSGLLDALARQYRVIALDNRGHGLSDKPHEPGTYGVEMVHDVIRLLDHLAIERAHVVGYSMGGFITMKLLTLYPDRLISAAPCGAGWPRRYPERVAMLENLVVSLREEASFMPLIQVLHPPEQMNAAAMQTIDFTLSRLNDTTALAACIEGLFDLEISEEELAAIDVPVLNVIGDRDPLKEDVDALEGKLRNHKVVIVRGGDHLSTVGSGTMREAILNHIAEHSLANASGAAS